MKIKMNMSLISIAQQETVKMAMADFKAYFTEQDLVKIFAEKFDVDCYGEVIKCDVEAFLINDWDEDSSFMVDIILRNSIKFFTLHFYVDEHNGMYSVNSDPLLHEMVEYKMA